MPCLRPHRRALAALGDVSDRAGAGDPEGDRFERTPFRAPRWASGPHAQTLLARTLRSSAPVWVERERIGTPDGDFIDVDWSPDPGADAPVVLILHGLEGSSNRRYVTSVAGQLAELGVHAVGMNFRGCSGEPNRTVRFYHSGETTDPAFVLRLLRDRFPGRPIGAMGFSLGGNVLLKLMGERKDGGRDLVDAAVAMSVPYDLEAGCSLLERTGMGRVYARYFLRSLRKKVRAKASSLQEVIDVDAALKARSVREFDERVTAPLHGFADASEYYARCSSVLFLAGVRVPTLLLHATDDPFLPASSIPIEAATGNPATTLVLAETGGHVGFLEGSPWTPRLWGDVESARYLARQLSSVRPSPDP